MSGRDHIGVEYRRPEFVYAGTDARLPCKPLFLSYSMTDHIIPELCGQNRVVQNRRHGRSNCSPVPFFELDEAECAAEDLRDEGQNGHNLTARQKTVLELLGLGQSNKAIARRLGMREGTVKVHVLQIMRKFGVSNRTQVAIVCANEGNQKLATADSDGSSLAASSI